tara:strand:- start:1195 stop:2346 length:1152 start_codon:yes stop_codon:yes gene_type:complete
MYKNIIDKIKSCLPANRDEYVIHEPFFDNKSYNDSKKCLNSSFVSTQGHYLEKFELKLKDVTGSNHVILTNTGTAALFLSLKINNINQTEVLVPSMTFVATVNAILYNNGIPHFIDCEEDSPNIDLEKLNQYLSDNLIVKNNGCFNRITKNKVSSIIVVHAYGLPVDINKLRKITKKYKLEIIEDAAGALGSFYNDKHVGISSRASILSFNGNKIVTTGMGGAILLKNYSDYKKIKHIISTARKIHKWKVEHDVLGYNLRMANINASIGYNQLCNLKKTLSLKTKLFSQYKKVFKDDKYCYINSYSRDSKPNNWVINLMLKDDYIKNHQELLNQLHKNKLYLRELWKPQHLSKYLKNYPKSDLKNTINIWKKTISLPSCYYKS